MTVQRTRRLSRRSRREKPKASESRKRGAEHISSPEANKAKKKVVSRTENTSSSRQTTRELRMEKPSRSHKTATEPRVSYATITKGVRLAVLPVEVPEKIRMREEQGQIEELLVEEMLKGWKSKLAFGGIHFRPSLILIDCGSNEVAEWLSNIVPVLEGWTGAKITTCKGDEIPAAHMVTV